MHTFEVFSSQKKGRPRVVLIKLSGLRIPSPMLFMLFKKNGFQRLSTKGVVYFDVACATKNSVARGPLLVRQPVGDHVSFQSCVISFANCVVYICFKTVIKIGKKLCLRAV